MGLKLMKDNGTVRRVWYGQYKEQGKWKVTKLTTPMRGTVIPDSLSGTGDAAFEKSRALAQAEFDRFEAERMVKGSAEHLTRVLIDSKLGQRTKDVPVRDLEREWRILHPRSRSEKQEAKLLYRGWTLVLKTEAKVERMKVRNIYWRLSPAEKVRRPCAGLFGTFPIRGVQNCPPCFATTGYDIIPSARALGRFELPSRLPARQPCFAEGCCARF